MKHLLTSLLVLVTIITKSQNPLEEEKWKRFFDNRTYEEEAMKVNDRTFWKVNSRYTPGEVYPLLLIYDNSAAFEINMKFEGLDELIYKKRAVENDKGELYEKENIAYMVFDSMLFMNPMVGNMIDGDFLLVYKKGPLGIYREYYSTPITKELVHSRLGVYHLSEAQPNIYLGNFTKKLGKLVGDYKDLSRKVLSEVEGYRADKEPAILRIAEEYNRWVEENYTNRKKDFPNLVKLNVKKYCYELSLERTRYVGFIQCTSW